MLSGYWNRICGRPALLPDGAVAVLRGAVLVAEPQPPVRRVGQGGLGAGGDGPLGLLDGDLGALTGDPGDDRDLVTDLVHQGFDDLDLLVLGQEGALTGVPEHDQRLHPVDRGQELAEVGQGGVVHVAVDRERGDRGGVQSTQIQISERHRRLLLGKLCGNVPVLIGLTDWNVYGNDWNYDRSAPPTSTPSSAVTAVTPIRLTGVVTLRDVARVAGVSISTASRVLDERLPRLETGGRGTGPGAAADLGYVRDPLASGLRRSGTSTIGVIVPRLTDTVMAMLYEEIAAAAAARGLFAVVATTQDRPRGRTGGRAVPAAPAGRRDHPRHRPHRLPAADRRRRPAGPGPAHRRHPPRLDRRRPPRRVPGHPQTHRPRPHAGSG